MLFIYQRIGFVQFKETSFEEAERNLFSGELDPRLLISYFPELRGKLFGADETVNLFAGVAEHMPNESSVDEISKFSLTYSRNSTARPHPKLLIEPRG
jgi:vacuolar protein sorting-associated protein 3